MWPWVSKSHVRAVSKQKRLARGNDGNSHGEQRLLDLFPVTGDLHFFGPYFPDLADKFVHIFGFDNATMTVLRRQGFAQGSPEVSNASKGDRG
jgi:hypothetical protein